MNRVTAVGHLAADPELRSAASGVKLCRMRLAIPRRKRAGEDQGAVFIDVVAFEGLASACANFLKKGAQVSVDGRLEYRTWEARDGSKRAAHEVIAQEVTFLGKPPARAATPSEEHGQEPPTSASLPRDEHPLAAASA